jgi:hypothetical protein
MVFFLPGPGCRHRTHSKLLNRALAASNEVVLAGRAANTGLASLTGHRPRYSIPTGTCVDQINRRPARAGPLRPSTDHPYALKATTQLLLLLRGRHTSPKTPVLLHAQGYNSASFLPWRGLVGWLERHRCC